MKMTTRILFFLSITLFFQQKINAQLTLPPDGENQRSEVAQFMGLVKTTIAWNSCDVHDPQGKDRRGHIWGDLVPYGLNDQGFGESSEANPTPWRAGSNQNTTVEFSHDVKINGQTLAAGRYGFFIIVEKEPSNWTLIFSKNSTSWGAFFYKKSEDALRIEVKPQPCAYTEWITYEFDDRHLDHCLARMRWEERSVEFKIEPAAGWKAVYLEKIRQELRNDTGFRAEAWSEAAQWCVDNQINLDEALMWADYAISARFVGVKNFQTLLAKAAVLNALKRTDEAEKLMTVAIHEPTATTLGIHQFGRRLLAQGKKEAALAVFKYNEERNPTDWIPKWGLARCLSAMGDYKTAIQKTNESLKLGPDAENRKLMETSLKTLEAGKDFN